MIARFRRGFALAFSDVRDEAHMEPGELPVLVAAGLLAATLAVIDRKITEGLAP